MALSNDLLSQFAKGVTDNHELETDTVLYGTVVEYEGDKYVQIDGGERLTPIYATEALVGDRVSLQIKNHSATVTGNLSSPSARIGSVEEINGKLSIDIGKVSANLGEFENLTAENFSAVNGRFETVEADVGDFKELTAENFSAVNGRFETVEADVGTFKQATADNFNAVHADIHDLEVTFGKFEDLDVEELEANIAKIENLDATYANIDFANIGEAALTKLFADTGLIKDLTVGDNLTVTGELVGVTLRGDVIEGNTVIADKLVLRDVDTGLLYKINQIGDELESEQIDQTEYNSLNGKILIAKSVTAEKVNVNDLVAFGAKLANFTIEIPKDENGESTGVGMFYSGAKSSVVDNSTEGIYLDSEGQMNIGGTSNYLKYYKTEDDSYKLEIAAGSILLGASGEDVGQSIDEAKKTAADAEAQVLVIEGKIQNLITDENGTSLLTQTADGWTFNMSEIQNALSLTSQEVKDLMESQNGWDAVVAALQSRIDDLDGLAEYVQISTYEEVDENGTTNTRPCIYLGEGDSYFKLRVTNTEFVYSDGFNKKTSVTQDGLETGNLKVDGEFTHSGVTTDDDEIGYTWAIRNNGNYGLKFNDF